MAFHGIDTREITTGPVPVAEVPSGITSLVGIAPKGPINQLILVNNPTEAVQFGSPITGFDIPGALTTHFGEGGQPVMVVNVFDPALHTTAVASENITLVAGKGKTAFPPISNLVVKHSSGTPSYVKDTDYIVDDYGNIQSINNTTIAQTATIQVSYNKPDFTKITPTEIIGTVNGTTGARSGYKCLAAAYNLYGKEPKILISPGYSHLSAVDAEMRYWEGYLKAVALIDAPAGTTVSVAKTSRGPAGTINFNIADDRAPLMFPRLKSYDPATSADAVKPYSQFLSGIMGRVDSELGFWYSPSNKPIRTATGTEVTMTSSAINPGTDAQDLNDLGIITVLNEGASGLRTWGNRSSAYPSRTDMLTFLCVRRTVDIAIRSIQLSAVQFVDLPMVPALRDTIRESGNAYLRSLIGRGALLDGSELIYDPAKNPISQTSAGRWVFTLRWCPPPPFENGTFESYVDVNLLSALNENL